MAQVELANIDSVADGLIQKFDQAVHERMIGACLGSYEEVWYKFKPVENLCLLILYYYQHQWIMLDKKIEDIWSRGRCSERRAIELC